MVLISYRLVAHYRREDSERNAWDLGSIGKFHFEKSRFGFAFTDLTPYAQHSVCSRGPFLFSFALSARELGGICVGFTGLLGGLFPWPSHSSCECCHGYGGCSGWLFGGCGGWCALFGAYSGVEERHEQTMPRFWLAC